MHIFCGQAFCTAQDPAVDRIDALNLTPGLETTIVVHGQNLQDAVALWTPVTQLSVQAVEGKPNDKLATFTGTVPMDAVPGLYPVRIISKRGVSSVRQMVLDNLPGFSLPDAAENPAVPTPIPVPCAINGFVNALKPKFLSLQLEANQSVSIDVFARRLGSMFDPVLRLTDDSGRELAFQDDIAGLQGDAQIAFVAPAKGTYRLELRDVQYTGSAKHFFHLRVGQFPLVLGTLPRLTTRDQPANLVLADGSALPVNNTASGSFRPISVANEDQPLAFGTVFAGTRISQAEQEPNNDQEHATQIAADAEAVHGCFQAGRDTDWFRLSGDAQQHICVTSYTRRVGSPSDVVLQLWDAAGKKLVEVDDSGTTDAQLTTKLPAAGQYYLAVRELSGQGGPHWTYDLQIDRQHGRVDATTTIDHLTIPDGGTGSIPVTVKRTGQVSGLRIESSDLSEAFVASPVYLAPNQSSAVVTFRLKDGTAAGTNWSPLQLVVVEASESHESAFPVFHVDAAAKPGTASYDIAQLQSELFVGGSPSAQFALQPDSDTIQVSSGSSATVNLTAVRQEKWTEPIDVGPVFPKEMPPGISVANVKIEKESGAISITADPKAIPGRYSLFLQGTLKKDKTTVVQPVPNITIEITAAEKVAEGD